MEGIIRDGKVKTIKDHKCHGCLKIIPKGTEVYSQTVTWDGKIENLYLCNKCNNWCKKHNCADCYDGNAYEGYINECIIY